LTAGGLWRFLLAGDHKKTDQCHVNDQKFFHANKYRRMSGTVIQGEMCGAPIVGQNA
jgi:hypothetical protein